MHYIASPCDGVTHSTSLRFDLLRSVHSTPPITKIKYTEIFLRYRQLFVKCDVFIGEWEIFGTEVYLHYSQFLVKGDFVMDGVECTYKETKPHRRRGHKQTFCGRQI